MIGLRSHSEAVTEPGAHLQLLAARTRLAWQGGASASGYQSHCSHPAKLCQRGSVGSSGGGNPRSSTSPAHLDTPEWKAWVGGAAEQTQHHCPAPQSLAWPWRGATGQLRLSGPGQRGPLSGARAPAERGSSWAQPRLPGPLTDIYREPSTCQHGAGPRGAAGGKGSRELAGMFPKFLGAPQSSEEACVSSSG